MWRLFDGGVLYFESWIQQRIVFAMLFVVLLTELTSFDFDYNKAMGLGGAYHSFVSNAVLIQDRC